ncbi:hypothetical protein [Thiomicrorhabdus sp.]|uniref:hypothetical protein n=1 Tax=Thiomicrorhabdus sp. TaxID=2039724 RepID=UPI003561DD66
MKVVFSELANSNVEHGEALAELLKESIQQRLPELQNEFVQDLSHISQAASFSGNMTIDGVEYLKDHLYRCDYSYDWQIAWTCAGTQEAGRVNEKVRFTVDDNGELHFKFLKLDA